MTTEVPDLLHELAQERRRELLDEAVRVREARRAALSARLQRRARRLSHRAERAADRADRTAARARLALARAL